MAYGAHYYFTFKNVDECDIGVTIFEKSYAAAQVQINASGSQPVVIDYKSGDLYANDPIRASQCFIRYINDGTLPITTFASNDDTKYFAAVFFNKPGGLASEIWRGFLSQDDSVEDMTPTPNEVSLTFNDGLGGLRQQYFTDLSGNIVTGTLSLKSVFYYILAGKTGLTLPVRIYCNLFESAMSNRTANAAYEPFSQTFIDANTFLITTQTEQDFASGPNAQIVTLKDKVQDCYTIMQNILDAWGCTIVQANGYWNIVRWFELKQFNNAIPGTQYDATLSNPTAITLDNIKVIQNASETANYQTINLTQSRQLFKGNYFVRNTFNYVQPYNILLNQDLSHLGTLLNTTNNGLAPTNPLYIVYKDYTFNSWVVSPDNSVVTYPLQTYIRVEFNYISIEIKRYAVVARGVIGQSIWATVLKVNANDMANLSFRTFTNNTTATGTTVYNIKIFPPGTTNFTVAGGVNYYGLKIDSQGYPYWAYNSSGWAYYHTDLMAGASVSIDMPNFPMDGAMLVSLPTATTDGSGTSYTAYTGINFTMYSYIAGGLQVTGQYNESKQSFAVKKNIEKVVYFDDSPKDNVQGVMFLTDGTTKTSSWRRWPIAETRGFGFIQTVDWMYLTNNMRAKVSGSYKGMSDSTTIFLSALSVIQFQAIANSNYIFGQCSFDFKNAEFTGTLQEVYNTGEYPANYIFPGIEFTNTFSYLYASNSR